MRNDERAGRHAPRPSIRVERVPVRRPCSGAEGLLRANAILAWFVPSGMVAIIDVAHDVGCPMAT